MNRTSPAGLGLSPVGQFLVDSKLLSRWVAFANLGIGLLGLFSVHFRHAAFGILPFPAILLSY